MENRKLLVDGGKYFGIDIDEKTVDDFMLYKKLLLEWNEKMNLTRITDEKEIIIKHFIDSLSLASCADFEGNIKLIDIGTGAGFPGIPLKLVYPNMELTLMDSLNKRINFLDSIIEELGLENVETFHMRAEDGGKKTEFREKYNIACARAVKNLSILSELCLPYVMKGGLFIAMKGPDHEGEIKSAENIINSLGGEIIDVKNIVLPYTDMKRALIVIKKIRPTNHKYPRKYSDMLKE